MLEIDVKKENTQESLKERVESLVQIKLRLKEEWLNSSWKEMYSCVQFS